MHDITGALNEEATYIERQKLEDTQRTGRVDSGENGQPQVQRRTGGLPEHRWAKPLVEGADRRRRDIRRPRVLDQAEMFGGG